MEAIIIPMIVFGFTALIVKMGLDYSKWKKIHQSGGREMLRESGDNSLGVSELKSLIREAVVEANQPLAKRLDHLEKRMEGRRELNAPETPPQLKGASVDDAEKA